MKRVIQRSLLALLVLALLAGALLLGAAWWGDRKMQRQVDLPASVGASLVVPAGAAAVERGRYLYLSRGCVDCHAVNGGGKTMIDDGGGMYVFAPNITPGAGSAAAGYRDVDWDRVIRHGVKRDGRPAIVMPSEDFARLTDADLGALVAFMRQLPPVAGRAAEFRMPLPVRAMFGVGLIRDAAAKIDHRLPPSAPVPEAVTAEHGAYVANGCIGCHGADLSGGKIPGAPPDWPPASNLRPVAGGALATYPDAQSFAAMMRSGKRPDGSSVSTVMPFESLKQLNDVDVQALYLHLKSLPPQAAR